MTSSHHYSIGDHLLGGFNKRKMSTNKRKMDGEKMKRNTRAAVSDENSNNKLPLNLPLHLIGEDALKMHMKKETRSGIIYSDEINFLRKSEEAGESAPVLQMTPELLGTAEYSDSDSDCEVDKKEDENEDEDSVWEDVDEEDDFVANETGKLVSRKEATPFAFYYRGDCEKDLKNHDNLKRKLICRCSKWHLIAKPQFYSLVDHQYTLFEVLKGNQESVEAGLILEGHFYNTFGKLLCNTTYDTVADEYSIKPVCDVCWD